MSVEALTRAQELEAALRALMHAVDAVLVARIRMQMGTAGYSDSEGQRLYREAVDVLDAEQERAGRVLFQRDAK